MIQQRNKIITDLYVSKDFNNCINKMEPDHLREDLKQEVMVILLGKEPSVICGLHQRGELNWYVVRVILNMVRSNSSGFTKQYRKITTVLDDVMDKLQHIPYVNGAELNIRMRRELTEQAIKRFIGTELYWYDKEIVELYVKLGSYRAIEKETGIPWESCYGTVRRVQDRIRKEVLNVTE